MQTVCRHILAIVTRSVYGICMNAKRCIDISSCHFCCEAICVCLSYSAHSLCLSDHRSYVYIDDNDQATVGTCPTCVGRTGLALASTGRHRGRGSLNQWTAGETFPICFIFIFMKLSPSLLSYAYMVRSSVLKSCSYSFVHTFYRSLIAHTSTCDPSSTT